MQKFGKIIFGMVLLKYNILDAKMIMLPNNKMRIYIENNIWKLWIKSNYHFETWKKYLLIDPDKSKYIMSEKLYKIGNYILDNNLYAGIYHIIDTLTNEAI